MTIATTQIRKSYACDGTTTEFPFPYQFLLDSDLVVLLVDDATGNFSTLTLSTDYTVSGGDGSSGTVTTTSAYASGKTLVIYNDPAPTQGLDLVEGDELPPEEVEKAFDRLTLLHQRQDDRLDRALVVSDSDTSGADFTVPAPQALKYMRWNAAGNALELMALEAAGDLAVSSYIETLLDDADEDAALTTLGVPLTADTYLRRNAGNTAFEAKTVAQVAAELIAARDWRGKNAIINGNFDVWQRGTSQTGWAGGFLADRWRPNASGITLSVSRQAFTLGQTDVPGEPAYFHRVSTDSLSSAAGEYAQMDQWIESVRTFAGQTVTLSFYAKADAAKDIAIGFVQEFGSGGSPSSPVYVTPQTVSLTTSWQKFEMQFDIPSISGKTLGSNNNDALRMETWLTAGTDFDARAASIGHQTIVFDQAQVQLEAGSVATPFERRHIAEELALCQRYFEKSYGPEVVPGTASTVEGSASVFVQGASTSAGINVQFKVSKRAIPTVVTYSTSTGASGKLYHAALSADFTSNITNAGVAGFLTFGSYSSTDANIRAQWTADAELV